jgi:hypothetical protein
MSGKLARLDTAINTYGNAVGRHPLPIKTGSDRQSALYMWLPSMMRLY